MIRDQAIQAAETSARAVFALLSKEPIQPSGWHKYIMRETVSLGELADFIDQSEEAGAEAVYIKGCASRAHPPSWVGLEPYERVVIEVFRATYLIGMKEVRSIEAKIIPLPTPVPDDAQFRGLDRVADDYAVFRPVKAAPTKKAKAR